MGSMKFEEIILKNEFYFPFIYILTIIGVILSNFYKVDSPIYFIITIFLLPYSCLYLVIIYDKFLKNKSNEFTLKFIRFFKIVGVTALILNTILLSIFYFSFQFLLTGTTSNFILMILSAFVLSLTFNNTLRKRLNIFNDEKIEHVMNSEFLISFLGLGILYIILKNDYLLDALDNLINIILTHLPDYSTISLAIVMLCATLAVLSFTYTMVDNQEGKDKMNENGKGYFISTIISMVILLLILISSKIKPVLINSISIENWFNFILVNIYAISIIIIFILTIYLIYYMISCSISSLKILKFIE